MVLSPPFSLLFSSLRSNIKTPLFLNCGFSKGVEGILYYGRWSLIDGFLEWGMEGEGFLGKGGRLDGWERKREIVQILLSSSLYLVDMKTPEGFWGKKFGINFPL